MEQNKNGQMTVQEAGRKGGKIGGRTTKERYGEGFYSEIGTKGGHRVRELIQQAKQMEGQGRGRTNGRR